MLNTITFRETNLSWKVIANATNWRLNEKPDKKKSFDVRYIAHRNLASLAYWDEE